MSKPSIPKGTRDFLPSQTLKRKYIFETIEEVFKFHGFLPIETPAMEKTETLMGKYGEEGDRLIFKILNSGDFTKSATDEELSNRDIKTLTTKISEKALRYDLTVPFARFVVQNQNDITFPFKRYQIQPVWRADRPQKGRYREFYQCDVDIIGTDSLYNELELVQVFDEVLTKLGLSSFTIKINNRKILAGLAEVMGAPDQLIDITVAIDKLDKIGEEKVIEELKTKNISDEAIAILKPLFQVKGDPESVFKQISSIVQASEIGRKGIEELNFIFSRLDKLNIQSANIEFDPSLARGLNYYTGAIFEVKADGVSIGSICGGGRYDDLTGIFGVKDLSGVGISFGADRIYDVLEELDLFPESISNTPSIMFANFGEKEADYCLSLVSELRELGVSAELYPEKAKMKKQMGYADTKQFPFVALIGSNEIENDELNVKNMETGEQMKLTKEELVEFLGANDE